MDKKNIISIIFARTQGLPGLYDQLDQNGEQLGVLRTAAQHIFVAQLVCSHTGSIIGDKGDGSNPHPQEPAHDCFRHS